MPCDGLRVTGFAAESDGTSAELGGRNAIDGFAEVNATAAVYINGCLVFTSS